MPRQPEQVHIFPYHKNKKGDFEFALFQRSDDFACWQGISGGVEDDESLEEAARREIFEESGINKKLPLYKLDTVNYLPSYIFGSDADRWGSDVLVIPMYFFALPYNGKIKISDEHNEYRWCSYAESETLIYWHDQKTAMWELHQRLLRNNLI